MVSIGILGVSAVAGCLGAILGIGGGIILTPILTLAFGVDIRHAVGASIVSVIATSSGSAASYVRDRLTNIRLAIFLEMATTTGALVGVGVATKVHSNLLYFIFSLVLLQSAYFMWRKKGDGFSLSQKPHPWSSSLKFNSQYPDTFHRQTIEYQVASVPQGFLTMFGAGILSGLLGIGSGALKVLALDRIMGLPMKVSSATSNFMMGVTAAASAAVYFFKGEILPELAAPVALGVLIGAGFGARLMRLLPADQIRKVFILVLILMAIQMGLKGVTNG